MLGADLPKIQWESFGDEFGDLGNHHCLKVPHHASITSVSEVIGTNTTKKDRFWIATPWRLASGKLPRFDDNQGVDHLLRAEPRLHLTSLPADCDLEGAVPYMATRKEIYEGIRPKAIHRDVAPGFRLKRRRDLSEVRFYGYVVVPISESGEVGVPIYGDGSIVVNR